MTFSKARFLVLTGFFICNLFGSFALASAKTLTLSSLPKTLEWSTHEDWLGLQLDPTVFASLKKQIELSERVELISRGEAHITIITPPEFKSFQGKLPMSELESLLKSKIQKAHWQPVCVGKGQAEGLKAYYLVVKSKPLLEIRKDLKELLKAKGIISTFSPLHYYPHVTIGFTVKDLHEQDGVIKNKASCIFDIEK